MKPAPVVEPATPKPAPSLTGAAMVEQEPRLLVPTKLEGFALMSVERTDTGAKAMFEAASGPLQAVAYFVEKTPHPTTAVDATHPATKIGSHDGVQYDENKERRVTTEWRAGEWIFGIRVLYAKPGDRKTAQAAAPKLGTEIAAWADAYLDADAGKLASLKSRDSHVADLETNYLGTTFTLGKFSYRVTGTEGFKQISGAGGYVSEQASPGAVFLAVHYTIKNEGNETATALADDFELVDSQGRKFRPSSRVTTAYIMAGGDKDLALTELQPGIAKPSIQLFEIPEAATSIGPTGTKLRIPEKGVLGKGEASVILVTRDGRTKLRQR